MVAALLAGMTWVYVFPREDDVPEHADAVLVLGPATHARTELARRMVVAGIAKTLVVSVWWADYIAPVGERDVSVCDDPTIVVICFVAVPETTSGEGEVLAQLAQRNGWKDVIVITQTPHLERARLILARCWDGRTWMRASAEPADLGGWIFEYAYQTAGYLKMLTTTRCAPPPRWIPILARPSMK
ncbi:hypothetical protein [Rathayibacter sp. VKM Ac-2878]|uniref:hypothetical protein n=1 Tax=Rathayibacter sp. VKM Ac-2878 TaxID=2783831 RepID=UPI00188C8D91|nr:hypothetical protein [Rathayibacter sp. VKM Ac-2878]MBF4463520.1 hypothetical protein [Rathayibacter sp. VKM Ac-2879]MBF4504758.1 hypothetical protein [Rathayibacter sp. VKM Ac-2878]